MLKEICIDDTYVILNMDETAVQHEYEARKGFVIDMHQRDRSAAGCFFSPLKMSKTRAHTTYVAFISENPLLQEHLPQFVLPNKNRTTRREMEAFNSLGDPILTIPDSTGWVNAEIMKYMLTEVRRRLRVARGANTTVVLFMDGASQHLSQDVLVHAARLQIILVLIPSQLTWLLQPLDVECFRSFKDLLRYKQLLARLDSQTNEIASTARVNILGETIREHFVEKTWPDAFHRVGISGNFNNLKLNIAQYLGAPSSIVPRRLTQEEMICLVGRERAGIADRFFRAPELNRARRLHMHAAIEAGPFVADHAAALSQAEHEYPVGIPMPPGPPPAPPPLEPPPAPRRSLPESEIARRTRSRTSLESTQ